MKRVLIYLISCSLALTSLAQNFEYEELNRYADDQFFSVAFELREMLAIPNDASFPDHVQRNVVWMERSFQKRGFQVEILDTGGPPILIAGRDYNNVSGKTVLFYLQIDGQPVDSSKWHQESPYLPVLKEKEGEEWRIINWEELQPGSYDPEWRMFARSASDAKGPVAMFLGAIDIIDRIGYSPNYKIKVIMDFEEELGSPHLPAAVEKYKDILAADMLVILDGPRHISNLPTLTFGARGITAITLTVFGPRVPQHSGHYGNYAPNPALKLSRLLASMKDESGRVVIPGYYDDVKLNDETLKILAQIPDDETEIRRKIGVAEIDNVANTYQASLQYPSLNIRGMQSAWIGREVRTIIPATATAEIDVRLVPETNSDRLVGLIRDHIAGQGYHFVDGQPTEEERLKFPRLVAMDWRNSYAAFRTPYDSEIGIWLAKAMKRAYREDPIRIRMSGGSIPIVPFISILELPAVTVPNVNRDNNQHSPNENLRLGNLRDGIVTCLAILTERID